MNFGACGGFYFFDAIVNNSLCFLRELTQDLHVNYLRFFKKTVNSTPVNKSNSSHTPSFAHKTIRDIQVSHL